MLYLITAKSIENVIAGPPEEVIPRVETLIIPSLKMLGGLEREKKITGGSMAGQRALAFVIDSPSHEEVTKFLMNLPWWPLHIWKVKPLVTFQSQADMAGQVLQKIKAMSKK